MMVGRNLCDKCINNDDSYVRAFEPNFRSIPILPPDLPLIFPHFKLELDELKMGYESPMH